MKTVCLVGDNARAVACFAFFPGPLFWLETASVQTSLGLELILLGVAVRFSTHLSTYGLHPLPRKVLDLVAFSILLALPLGANWAQGNSAATATPAFVLDQCKRDVLAYQKNLETVRKSLGDKAAQEFADNFMTKEQWNESLLRDGYCAIARGLKANRLN